LGADAFCGDRAVAGRAAREGRLFTALGAQSRIAPGLALPAPTGAFPRFVDPTEATEAASKPKGKGKERG
jgi:hypothetical protein